MSENNLWKYIKDGMGWRWKAQRHEDKYSVGIPDVSYAIKYHGWIELKYLKSEPVLNSSIMRIKHFTPQQRNWLKTFGEKAGRCFILLQINHRYIIFSWEVCDLIGFVTYPEHQDIAIKIWDRSINWDELTDILNKR